MQAKRNIVFFPHRVYNISIKTRRKDMRFENEFAGLTVKQVLTEHLGFSRNAITALKKRPDGILLNGQHATVRAKISARDILEINFEDCVPSEHTIYEDAPMPDIIYEDGRMLAVSKPPHMPTHQSAGHYRDTLAASLGRYFHEMGRPFVFRAVNRLDKDTSGIVLIARDMVSCAHLGELMRDGGIRKTYLAILDGAIDSDCGMIETYIRRRSESVMLREVCDADGCGQFARTEYRVLARGGGLTLVEAHPLTGRTHQLRVHFAHLGAPILGDGLYGSPSELIDRHALHARSLDISDGAEGIRIDADIPSDMARVIEKYFGKEFLVYGRRT